jgi:hypothetical protein
MIAPVMRSLHEAEREIAGTGCCHLPVSEEELHGSCPYQKVGTSCGN